MKNLYLLALLCIGISPVYSQTAGIFEQKERKPGLFRQFPDSIPVDISSMDALIHLSAGSEVIIPFSASREYPLKGTVTASSVKYDGLIHSVSVRSSAPDGAIFHLTRTVGENGQPVFRGTWMHKDYAELYVLSHNGNDYSLMKKKFTDVVIE